MRPYEAAKVTLLSAGKGTGTALKYGPLKEQQLTVVAGGEWKSSTGGGDTNSPLPTMSMPLKLMPVGVAVEYVFRPGTVSGAPAGSQMESVTKLMLGALDGSGGLIKTDARGVFAQFLLHPGPNDRLLDAGAVERRSVYAMEMGRGLISLLSIPFPAEPIAVGARWQAERLAIRGGFSYLQVTTFTLVEAVGSKVKVTYRFGGKWDPGSGVRESEMKLDVSGGGKATLDLQKPLPVALEDEAFVSATVKRGDSLLRQSGVIRTRIESE